MNLSTVLEKFMMYAEMDSTEASKWEYLCGYAINDILYRLRSLSDKNHPAVINAAVTLAFYRYTIICGVNAVSFRAGDITVNERFSTDNAKMLWEQAEKYASKFLNDESDFLFKQI